LLATASHLCRPIEFLSPAYAGQRPSLAVLSLGVWMYDALAMWRAPVRSRRAPAGEVYQLAPLLRTAGLQGAQLYVDCQTDDTRLVLENVLDAENAGAVVASYVHLQRPSGQRRGHLRTLLAADRDTGETFEVRARAEGNGPGPVSAP